MSSWNGKFSSAKVALTVALLCHVPVSPTSLSANHSGTEPSPATGSEPTPESTAGLERDPWGQAANIPKPHGQMETSASGQGSRSFVKLSSTRNHSQHTPASLGSPWNSTGTGEQKEKTQMAKMSSHILSVQALQWHKTTWGLTSSFFCSSLFVSDEHTVL